MTPLLQVRGLTVEFPSRGGATPVRAVDQVSFDVPRGTTVGVVGGSGAGKTTLGRAVLGLVRAVSGTVIFDGGEVGGGDRASVRAFRYRAQPVFQDPQGSLSPRYSVEDSLREVLQVQGVPPDERPGRLDELLELVDLPRDVRHSRPHELSGGQLQRVAIARALAVEPEFLVLDEPVSALDVSVQAHILNLLLRLQSELALTYLFIAHDLAVVYRMSDRILVLESGRVLEEGTPDMVLRRPVHPYTRTLVEAALPGSPPG